MSRKITVEEKESRKIIERFTPLLQKLLYKIHTENGAGVCATVASNIATSLMAYSVTIVMKHNGDINEFMKMMIDEVCVKCTRAKKVDGENHNNTCQPLH
jgi:dihydroxyacetone kinase